MTQVVMNQHTNKMAAVSAFSRSDTTRITYTIACGITSSKRLQYFRLQTTGSSQAKKNAQRHSVQSQHLQHRAQGIQHVGSGWKQLLSAGKLVTDC
jgi:hypothetical protein